MQICKSPYLEKRSLYTFFSMFQFILATNKSMSRTFLHVAKHQLTTELTQLANYNLLMLRYVPIVCQNHGLIYLTA